MNRLLVCIIAALGFALFRGQVPTPAIPVLPPPAVVPVATLAKYRDMMTADERRDLSEAYAILSRSVAANPVDDPVIPTVAALHDVHRAGVMFVWRGVLGNAAGKYEGLRGELEGLLRDKVGTADVPLNPAVQRDAATLFDDISRSIR